MTCALLSFCLSIYLPEYAVLALFSSSSSSSSSSSAVWYSITKRKYGNMEIIGSMIPELTYSTMPVPAR